MTKWQNKPFEIEVKKDTKMAFCACDLSNNGPYCDGSHKKSDTGKVPHIAQFAMNDTVYACGCQQSKSRPFCDGSHKVIVET